MVSLLLPEVNVKLTLIATYGIHAVLKYDNGRKYWLRLRAVDFEEETLPDILINTARKKDHIECQTLSLVKLNLRMSDTSNEVVIRSDAVIQGLLAELRDEVPHMFRICESVALADMIFAFGQLASTQNYVRPEITGTLALSSARHPVLDKVCWFTSICVTPKANRDRP